MRIKCSIHVGFKGNNKNSNKEAATDTHFCILYLKFASFIILSALNEN